MAQNQAFRSAFLVFTRVLVLVCLTACGQPRQDGSSNTENRLRAQSIAVAERFMRAVIAADSASIDATTTVSFAADLRRPEADSIRVFLQSVRTTFRPGDLIRGGDDLLLEFTYEGVGGQRTGYVRLAHTHGLKVAGILEAEH
jgi:hypothetical protein